MAKSKKSVKRKKKNPPLSKQDKFIYGCIETIGMIIILSFFDTYKIFTRLIIFKKPEVLAFEESLSFLLIVPFVFFLLFIVLKSSCKKVPIIGNKKIDYFNRMKFNAVFPVFDDRYKNNEEYLKGRKKFFKKSVVYFCVFIILLSIGCMGCIGRHEFNENGIVTYNILNNKTAEYSYDEVESFHVSTNMSLARRSRSIFYHTYGIRLTVNMNNGETFTAEYDNIRDVYSLEKIENQLKGKNKTVDSYYLQNFIDKYEFTDDELRVIDKIFER